MLANFWAYVLVIVILILIKLCYKRDDNHPPLLEGSVPIFGHSLLLLGSSKDLYKNFVNYILEPAIRKGLDVVRVNLCVSDIYVIHNADDAFQLLNECLKKDIFFDFFKPWFGDYSLIVTDEICWKRHRKLLNPTFHQKILTSFLTEMNYQSRKLVENLSVYVGKGPFDHFNEVKNITLQAVCATTMGTSMDDDDKKLKDSYIKSLEAFSSGMIERFVKFWLANDFVYSFSSLKRNQFKHANTLKKLSDAVIEKRKSMRNNEQLYDDAKQYKASLDLMLELGEEGHLTDEEIREEVDTLIAAGVDTTSTALTLILLHIASHPDVQKKIHAELSDVFGDSDRDVDRQDLNNVKYLEAVIKESLRLYPPVLLNARYVHKDLKLKNYTIEAGSRCFVSLYSILRGELWGSDAGVFDPDRWLDKDRLPKNSNAFPVFGLAKRSCIGINYVMMSMKTSVIHVLRLYKIKGDMSQLQLRMDAVIRPMSGYNISIENK